MGIHAGGGGKDRVDGANAPVVLPEGRICRQRTLLCRIGGIKVMATWIGLGCRNIMQLFRLGEDSDLGTTWRSGARQRERIGGMVAIMPGDLIEVGDGKSICRFPRVQARPCSTAPGSNGDGYDGGIGELLCDARGNGVASPVAMSRLHSPGHPSDMAGRQTTMGRTRRTLEPVQDADKLASWPRRISLAWGQIAT